MAQALLSIGIIFKDHIGTLERCLKSLQPLRDAIPCQLVMGDTGASDGSRELAEQYADVIVDFPWINDFSAARNAVMDACSSKWHFVLDVDEWLDDDISQLVGFLTNTRRTGKKIDFCTMIQRNYIVANDFEHYSDFFTPRIVRMSLGERYHGAIHETWYVNAAATLTLTKTVLHHDGYVGLNDTEKGRQKRARNMALLKEELKNNPNDLRRLLQCIESSGGDLDHDEYVQRALEGVRRKDPDWRIFGPAILHNNVKDKIGKGLEELEPAVEEALTTFPDTLEMRLDVQHTFCQECYRQKSYEKAISAGEAYLQALADYRAGRFVMTGGQGSLISVSPFSESVARLILASCYFQTKEYQKSLKRLTTVELENLSVHDFRNYIAIMTNLHVQGGLDMSDHMVMLWEYLEGLDESDPKTAQRRNTLTSFGGLLFPQSRRDEESAQGHRNSYTIFLPLAGKSEFGTAAQILEAADSAEAEIFLRKVENWNMFPIPALAHAIERGARFPLPDKPLKMEEMDSLARRLSAEKKSFFPLARRVLAEDFTENTQSLLWARGLSLAAVRAFAWKPEGEDQEVDIDTGLSLARSFAQTEKAFLPFCYSPQVLREETLSVLPPMHRFGWYCIQAFDALDRGDAAGCVRLLRSGLDVCNSVKDMVEFLLDRVEEMGRASRIAEAPPELIELARQVKLMLSRYAPNDPAVAELKNSPAYQQVAWLIEEPATKGEKIVQ